MEETRRKAKRKKISFKIDSSTLKFFMKKLNIYNPGKLKMQEYCSF